MSFFNTQEPMLRLKQTHLDVQDLDGLIAWRWTLNQRPIIAWQYTRIDQVFLSWGWITGFIFLTPQLFPLISWQDQALFWSAVSLVGIGVMTWLAWVWVKVERFRWLIYLWSAVVVVGLGVTDWGIFTGSGVILKHLCPLWLGLCALGYGVMGWGMRSRTFLLVAVLHGVTTLLLNLLPAYQFLTTAVVISSSLFFLAEVQWDMRPQVYSDTLSQEQNEFNRQQQQLRNVG